MTAEDRETHREQATRLAAESLAAHDPTGWFERLYAAAEDGRAVVPWDRGAPHPLLVEWASARRLQSKGRTALVVGCGLGDDAAYLAGLGFRTTAFDIAETAIRAARRRFAGTGVEYVTANLLDPPTQWHEAFDLVFESLTVQALPEPLRAQAIASVGRLVAGAGTLLVIATARDAAGGPVDGPPWPLVRAEVDAFATGGLVAVRVEKLPGAANPALHRWRAEFTTRITVEGAL